MTRKEHNTELRRMCREFSGDCKMCPCYKTGLCSKPGKQLADAEIESLYNKMKKIGL